MRPRRTGWLRQGLDRHDDDRVAFRGTRTKSAYEPVTPGTRPPRYCCTGAAPATPKLPRGPAAPGLSPADPAAPKRFKKVAAVLLVFPFVLRNFESVLVVFEAL